MAERRTTRSRPKDDDRPQDDERPQDDNLAGEYDDDLPPEEDGQAGDDAEAGDEVGDDAGQDEDADRRPPTRRKPRRATGGRSASGGRRPGLTAAEVARAGAEQIAELTGKPPETVTQVQPNGDSWTVGVEVVEDRRVPSSTDLMGLYEIDLDRSGDLLSYRRVKRYSRGRGDYGEDS